MTVKSKVTEVQIYRNGATVKREGTAHLSQGRNTVFIEGMCKSAIKDSFSIKFPVGIKALNIQIVGIEETKEENLLSKELKRKLEEVNYKIETCELMMQLRKDNGNFSGRSEISVEAQEQYMKELPEQLLELRKQIVSLNEEKEKIEKEIEDAVLIEENPLVMVELESNEEGEFPFLFQFQTSSAGWNPKYEVHFDGNDKPLEVNMKADIKQSTKEDWKQVKVTLYTGNPSGNQSLPDIYSEELSIYEPAPQMGMNAFMGMNMAMAGAAQASAMNMGMAAAQASTPVMEMAKVATAAATVSQEETMTAFELPDLRDVLSDADGNIANLQEFFVEAKYNVLSVPYSKDKCFMTASVKAEEWPLPKAVASVYLKDTYAGVVSVDPDSGKEEFTISLGQDERINVIRKEMLEKTKDVFLKNQKKRSHEYVIKITNKAAESVDVLIKDYVPVSTDKTIVVETNELSGGKVDENNGTVEWNISIDGKSTKELKLAYDVIWPKDKQIRRNKKVISSSKKFCKTCGIEVFGKFCPECGGIPE